jgi:hypothetical protein
MDYENPFDKKLELMDRTFHNALGTAGQTGGGVARFADVRDAAVFVVDTLDLSQAAAQSLFGEQSTPALVFEIYDRIVLRMKADAERKRREAEELEALTSLANISREASG